MNNIQVSQTITVKIKNADFVLTSSEAIALYNALGTALNLHKVVDAPPYQPYYPNPFWYTIPPVTTTCENKNLT